MQFKNHRPTMNVATSICIVRCGKHSFGSIQQTKWRHLSQSLVIFNLHSQYIYIHTSVIYHIMRFLSVNAKRYSNIAHTLQCIFCIRFIIIIIKMTITKPTNQLTEKNLTKKVMLLSQIQTIIYC